MEDWFGGAGSRNPIPRGLLGLVYLSYYLLLSIAHSCS